MKYKLNIQRDVDPDGDGFMLWLNYGWCFADEGNHVQGFDNMKDLRQAAKEQTRICNCKECNLKTKGN
jgi:hypothetical protein